MIRAKRANASGAIKHGSRPRPCVDPRGSFDKPQKKSVVVAAFGMPLNAQPKRTFRIFDCLNGAVGRASRGLEAGMADHRLPVVTAHLHPITHEFPYPGAFALAFWK